MGAVIVLLLVAICWTRASAGESNGFQLAPGDTLKLDILDDDKDPVDLLIAGDGTIQAPYLGPVHVAGLPIAEALRQVTEAYAARRIFIVPKIALSVATYRPVFVMGDVRQPGAYPFQPKLTAEKALGLAGGQITAAGGEDPIMARARLRGQLEEIEAGLIREALAIARLRAQLAGQPDILDEDVPAEARAYVDGPVAETLRQVEQQILARERDGFTERKQILTEGIAEAERGLVLLQKLAERSADSVAFTQSELERARKLQKQGIKTMNEVFSLERQLATDEARQLQVLANLSDDRRGIGLLRSQLADLEHKRHLEALTDLQTHQADLAKAIASRRAGEEQLMLLASMTAEDVAAQREMVLSFTIRREIDEVVSDVPAKPSTLLFPGDVLVVKIEPATGAAPIAALHRVDQPVQ
ncbi:polysaccharide biosynthesis/export family protein [Rhodoligotrophos defluvii]|uniref:polysaccharide biosynthesis/export family protein n=1 Tax=Rhodoligotrophos defluvii TaxID=2561934 RepID=UPI00148564E0|nr:polysaccharide biosynthesis/export family protein [Rhodoligotrophos defluvii]